MTSQPPPNDFGAPSGSPPPEPGSPEDPYRFGPPPAPGYGAYQYPPPRRSNGMAVAGMVLGILAIVFFWTSFLDLPFVVLAIVFSVLGLNAAKRGATGRRMAVAGLTCAIIGALAATAFTVWAVHKDRGCADKYGRGTHSYDLCVRNRV